jgi:hypothetical protein
MGRDFPQDIQVERQKFPRFRGVLGEGLWEAEAETAGRRAGLLEYSRISLLAIPAVRKREAALRLTCERSRLSVLFIHPAEPK